MDAAERYQMAREQAEREYACECQETTLRARVYRNGQRVFVRQCARCGQMTSALKAESLKVWEKSAAPPADLEAYDAWNERKWNRYRELREEIEREEREARRGSYARYLQSRDWLDRRGLRLQLDGGQRQARMSGCTGRATEVHHLDYRFLGNEPLFLLVSVCRTCHEQISAVMGHGAGEGAA